MKDELDCGEISRLTSSRDFKYRDVATPGILFKNWF
jgi:hypothetical protein